ncbi:MAG: N-acetylmuramate/N-acetylglucosamine kinase [Gammaproteobacteria bacterium]|nr:MAG: N-acetylmuramate/N-acetylglucosamine kinase [Gammaproteobacteria bacterium]
MQELIAWLSGIDGYAGVEPVPASADASFRRYFRVAAGGSSRIVMDAPPAREDSGPYVRIAAFLRDMGLHAPSVFAADLERGFLLLTDLGTTQYLQALRDDPGLADSLYADALRALATLQQQGATVQGQLPPYSAALLQAEMELFREWLCQRHLGLHFAADDLERWRQTCDFLVENALQQHQVFVHRDYHSRNLMLTGRDNPGILDFQDALEGPYTYDLVSLLKDCYISWPASRVRGWAMLFYEFLADDVKALADAGLFMRQFELMGVQRQLKAAGIFARLNYRDGKPSYMQDIPRTLGYISEIAPRYPQLSFIAGLIRRHDPGRMPHGKPA